MGHLHLIRAKILRLLSVAGKLSCSTIKKLFIGANKTCFEDQVHKEKGDQVKVKEGRFHHFILGFLQKRPIVAGQKRPKITVKVASSKLRSKKKLQQHQGKIYLV